MGSGVEESERVLKRIFPNLNDDSDFKVTSKRTEKYNCIAWAYFFDDRWMWPATETSKVLDGIYYFWPTEGISSNDVSSFIDAFKQKGYELCDSFSHEEGFQKIALYTKPGTTECTHAAREHRDGTWTSKIGALEDIQHGTPFSLSGDLYGIPTHFMKREI
ncbi:MAG: hypothetical protein E7108_08700 [Bacteroidales bacterium]|jgi:hypothetical protein|nr:hypothetical protein [Bacteroidales bacterium]